MRLLPFATLPLFAAVMCLPFTAVAQEKTDDLKEAVSIDFVRKDIHVVAHYLSIKSGWRITVDQDVQAEVTFSARSRTWHEMLEVICESNNLTFDVDEAVKEVRIHENSGRFAEWKEVRIETASRKLTACLAYVSVNRAIAAIARESQTPFLIVTKRDGTRQWKNGVFVYQHARASLYTDDMTAEEALRQVAKQGDLSMTWGRVDKDAEGWLFESMPLS